MTKRPFDRSDISSARVINEKIIQKLDELTATREVVPVSVVRHYSMTNLTHFKPATQNHSTSDVRLLELPRMSPLRR